MSKTDWILIGTLIGAICFFVGMLIIKGIIPQPGFSFNQSPSTDDFNLVWWWWGVNNGIFGMG